MTKKIFCFLILAIAVLKVNAQSYTGFFHDNYAGIQGVFFNPASIVDSRFKTDINLFSLNAAANNDIYGVNVFDFFKPQYDADKQANKTLSTSNSIYYDADLAGPSFMFNIAPKHAVAFFSRLRSVQNLTGLDGNLLDDISKDNKSNFSYNVNNTNMVQNAWGELGLSYAAVLFQKDAHFLKGGLNLKYLRGLSNIYVQVNKISVNYQKNNSNPSASTYTTTGTAVYGYSEDFNNNYDSTPFQLDAKGFGFDLGLIYEWRPDFDTSENSLAKSKHLNKYKLRLGLSVTDIGAIRYNKSSEDIYNLNKTITQNDFDTNNDDIDDFIKNNYTVMSAGSKKVVAKLPTAIHVDADWKIHNKFYANFNTTISAVKKEKLNQSAIASRFSITPRYESRWFSVFVPTTYILYNKQAQVGFGLRTGILFVGSGSVVSNLISDNSKGADVYLGLKIPVYQKKAKDKDGDGILDKNDKCPEVAGPEENNGCPWMDSDSDKILDKDDACPKVAGPIENKGCPWGDKDSDSILDNVDACPELVGPKENKGCPWGDKDKDGVSDNLDACPELAGATDNKGCPWSDTDGDSILDKDDKCPTVAGTITNGGCPEEKKEAVTPTKEVMKVINQYSKTILFDTGKNTIKSESFQSLDAIVSVLNEYAMAKFKIEGHTDNVGNAKKNLKLSKDRAKAVQDYLISKGINSNRLTSAGYGSKKPIATNKTAKGKNLNRRVEINLVP